MAYPLDQQPTNQQGYTLPSLTTTLPQQGSIPASDEKKLDPRDMYGLITSGFRDVSANNLAHQNQGSWSPDAKSLSRFLLNNAMSGMPISAGDKLMLEGIRSSNLASGRESTQSFLDDAFAQNTRNMLARGMDRSSTELYGRGSAIREGTRQMGELTRQENRNFLQAMISLPIEKQMAMTQLLEVLSRQSGGRKKKNLFKQLLPTIVGAGTLAFTGNPYAASAASSGTSALMGG